MDSLTPTLPCTPRRLFAGCIPGYNHHGESLTRGTTHTIREDQLSLVSFLDMGGKGGQMEKMSLPPQAIHAGKQDENYASGF